MTQFILKYCFTPYGPGYSFRVNGIKHKTNKILYSIKSKV